MTDNTTLVFILYSILALPLPKLCDLALILSLKVLQKELLIGIKAEIKYMKNVCLPFLLFFLPIPLYRSQDNATEEQGNLLVNDALPDKGPVIWCIFWRYHQKGNLKTTGF